MKRELRYLWYRLRHIRQTHAVTYARFLKTREFMPTAMPETLADMAICLREISRLADDVRKESNSLREQMERIACARWVQAHLNDPGNADPIRGELAIGTPDVKQMVSLPRRDTPEYQQLMGYLGVPAQLLKADLVRPHWPGFTDYVTKLAEEGKPLPPGIPKGKVYSVYRLALRKRAEF